MQEFLFLFLFFFEDGKMGRSEILLLFQIAKNWVGRARKPVN